MKFSELVNQTEKAVLEYKGQTVNLEYTPQFTVALRSELKKFNGDEDAKVLKVLATRIKKWDVLNDDESAPMPITEEFLSQCPDDFLQDLYTAINPISADPTNAAPSPST